MMRYFITKYILLILFLLCGCDDDRDPDFSASESVVEKDKDPFQLPDKTLDELHVMATGDWRSIEEEFSCKVTLEGVEFFGQSNDFVINSFMGMEFDFSSFLVVFHLDYRCNLFWQVSEPNKMILLIKDEDSGKYHKSTLERLDEL